MPMDDALSTAEEDLVRAVGFEDLSDRSATAIIVDQTQRFARSTVEGVEVLPLAEALVKYDWVQDLMFRQITPDENAHVRHATESTDDPVGTFVYVHPGVHLTKPLQSFVLLEKPLGRQFIHTLTVVGEGADLQMISGAAVPASVHAGHHVSIAETYVRRGARCRSVSIERWGSGMSVESYGRSEIGPGAELMSSQIMLSPVRHHLSDTRTDVAENAVSNDQAVILAAEGTHREIDTTVRLAGRGARAESLARMVCAGGTIVNRATLIGDAPGTSGFLGCDGLKLTDTGEIVAVPSLRARSQEAQLSHEASVGMIGEEKLSYLMASGLDEDAARDLILQGFLKLEDDLVPVEVAANVRDVIASAKSGGM